jgi:hypothetical protein
VFILLSPGLSRQKIRRRLVRETFISPLRGQHRKNADIGLLSMGGLVPLRALCTYVPIRVNINMYVRIDNAALTQ